MHRQHFACQLSSYAMSSGFLRGVSSDALFVARHKKKRGPGATAAPPIHRNGIDDSSDGDVGQRSVAVVSVTTRGLVIKPPKCSMKDAYMPSSSPTRPLVHHLGPQVQSISLRYSEGRWTAGPSRTDERRLAEASIPLERRSDRRSTPSRLGPVDPSDPPRISVDRLRGARSHDPPMNSPGRDRRSPSLRQAAGFLPADRVELPACSSCTPSPRARRRARSSAMSISSKSPTLTSRRSVGRFERNLAAIAGPS